jgi:hypothetical protein
MDNKTRIAGSTSLGLMQNTSRRSDALGERHTPGVPIKEEFHQLITEGFRQLG